MKVILINKLFTYKRYTLTSIYHLEPGDRRYQHGNCVIQNKVFVGRIKKISILDFNTKPVLQKLSRTQLSVYSLSLQPTDLILSLLNPRDQMFQNLKERKKRFFKRMYLEILFRSASLAVHPGEVGVELT